MAHEAILALFMRAELGHAGAGTNSVNRGQCTGLAALWLEAVSKPAIFADGKDYLTNADPAAYHVERNTPINYPHPGDLVSYSEAMGAGHGHVAIVVAANVHQLVVFEQNNPDGAAPLVATHDYANVLGWLSW
jgi:surface antigen